MQKHLKKHAFTLWLLFAVFLAVLFPAYGSKGGLLYPELSTNIGVWLIFFLQGIALPTSELTSGYSPKRLHAFVLSWNYIIFPIVVGLLLLPLSLVIPNELRLGFWLLAILPTTVSSAVVFSTVSKGNTSNAIFSTVFSNLISVLLVPAVAVAYLSVESGVSLPLSPLFSKLFLLIIAPLILGQLLRKWLPKTSALIANRTKGFGNWIIVFIVHCAFAQSVSSGFLIQLGLFSIFKVISITILILLFVSQLVWWSSNLFNLSKEQRISAFFCSSQKSLATGLPLTTSILALTPGIVDAASVLIPLMCYHPAQLILAAILSNGWGSK
ncbi:MAG: bile acid:sodium symporter family protein [Verrucomicrobiota bacterium]|nr:bile acid:sodium symporter family protein [Verrucomicrobiota bacterium]